MRENEFENRVKQKMDDFNLRPSDEIWTEVERRIRKEKKRRFIFWWPLLLLLAGGIAAGILLINKKEKNETITGERNTEKLSLPDGTAGQADGQLKITEPAANLKNETPETPENKTATAIIRKDITKTKTPVVKIITTPTHGDEGNLKETTVQKKPEAIKQVNTNNSIVFLDKKDKSRDDKEPVTVVPAKPLSALPDPAKTIDIAVTPKQDIQQKDQQQVIAQKAADITTVAKTDPPDKKSKKWDWSISFSVGRSSIGRGLQFFNGARYSDALQAGSPTSAPIRSPASIRPSFSWSTGVYIKKPVSKNLDINLGLGYIYLSTKMNVGERVDSSRSINNNYSSGLSVNNFYRLSGVTGLSNNTDNSNYTNQYHFISLSGDLSWRIINGKKLKVYWENGLHYNRLVSSTMLHYERSLPGYYKDNKRLTKDHVFISTGLSLPVGKKVVINPFATYSLTTVLKNTTDTSGSHYTNFGIRVRFLFNKNK